MSRSCTAVRALFSAPQHRRGGAVLSAAALSPYLYPVLGCLGAKPRESEDASKDADPAGAATTRESEDRQE